MIFIGIPNLRQFIHRSSTVYCVLCVQVHSTHSNELNEELTLCCNSNYTPPIRHGWMDVRAIAGSLSMYDILQFRTHTFSTFPSPAQRKSIFIRRRTLRNFSLSLLLLPFYENCFQFNVSVCGDAKVTATVSTVDTKHYRNVFAGNFSNEFSIKCSRTYTRTHSHMTSHPVRFVAQDNSHPSFVAFAAHTVYPGTDG